MVGGLFVYVGNLDCKGRFSGCSWYVIMGIVVLIVNIVVLLFDFFLDGVFDVCVGFGKNGCYDLNIDFGVL